LTPFQSRHQDRNRFLMGADCSHLSCCSLVGLILFYLRIVHEQFPALKGRKGDTHTPRTLSTEGTRGPRTSPCFDLQKKLVRDLNVIVHQQPAFLEVSPSILKGLAAATPWILVNTCIRTGRSRRGEHLRDGGRRAPFCCSLGLIGAALPNSWSPQVLYIGYPLGHFFVLVLVLLLIYGRKKRATNQRSPKGSFGQPDPS